MPAIRTTRTVRDFIRDLCATTSAVSQSNLISLGQVLREGGDISQAGPGGGAASATTLDGATLLIAAAIKPKLKDAVEEVRKYGGLILEEVSVNHEDVPGETDNGDPFVPMGYSLRHTLEKALEQCSREGPLRFSSLSITRSQNRPKAYLELNRFRIDDSGDTRISTINLKFEPNEQRGQQLEDVRETTELSARLLNTATRLLAPNVAAANRARMQAEHENGPSVSPDEPLPSNTTSRGANPETTGSHLEAKRERDKSQAGFESYGDASDGSPLSNRGSTDDYRPRRYG